MKRLQEKKRVIFKRWQKLLFLFGGCLLILGCPPPETILMPQAADEITLVNTNHGADTAQIKFGEVVLDISGRWSPNGSVIFNINVQNNSDTPFRFDLRDTRVENEAGQPAKLEDFSEIVEGELQDNGNRMKWVSIDKDKPIIYLPKQHRPVVSGFQFELGTKLKMESGKKVKFIFPNLAGSEKKIEIWFKCDYN